MEYTIKQKSKITTQGPQYLINIRKEFHEKLAQKHLLGKDLDVTIILKTID